VLCHLPNETKERACEGSHTHRNSCCYHSAFQVHARNSVGLYMYLVREITYGIARLSEGLHGLKVGLEGCNQTLKSFTENIVSFCQLYKVLACVQRFLAANCGFHTCCNACLRHGQITFGLQTVMVATSNEKLRIRSGKLMTRKFARHFFLYQVVLNHVLTTCTVDTAGKRFITYCHQQAQKQHSSYFF
jgi:hypothetical protein